MMVFFLKSTTYTERDSLGRQETRSSSPRPDARSAKLSLAKRQAFQPISQQQEIAEGFDLPWHTTALPNSPPLLPCYLSTPISTSGSPQSTPVKHKSAVICIVKATDPGIRLQQALLHLTSAPWAVLWGPSLPFHILAHLSASLGSSPTLPGLNQSGLKGHAGSGPAQGPGEGTQEVEKAARYHSPESF